MNKLEIKKDWLNLKNKLHQNWGNLTDNDLQFEAGQEDELIRRIQKRTGETWKTVEQTLREYVSHSPVEKSVEASGPTIL